MVRIRLRRQGAKGKPSYRVVVADSRSPRDGRFIENIGFYDPRAEPPAIRISAERALYWLGQGAQPSDTVLRLLRSVGIWQQFKGAEDVPTAEVEETPAEVEALPETKAKGKRTKADKAEAEATEILEAAESEAAEATGSDAEE